MNRDADFQSNLSLSRHSQWSKQTQTRQTTDANLAAAATDAISCLTTIPLESLKVTARQGWLHLEGAVSYAHQRATIEDVTRNLPGVRGLTDVIVVKPIPAEAQI